MLFYIINCLNNILEEDARWKNSSFETSVLPSNFGLLLLQLSIRFENICFHPFTCSNIQYLIYV